jgi:hypothetical protein
MIDFPVEDEIKEMVATVEHIEHVEKISTMEGPANKRLKSPVLDGLHGQDRPLEAADCRTSCSFDCYCSCHSEDGGESASLLLKLNITALGIIVRSKRPCSNPKCQRTVPTNRKKLVFSSPDFRKALTSLMMIRSWSRKHHLNTYRIVPETSDSMRYAKHGDLQNLKACIEDGSATPFDTAPDGWSLLHVSPLTLVITMQSLRATFRLHLITANLILSDTSTTLERILRSLKLGGGKCCCLFL